MCVCVCVLRFRPGKDPARRMRYGCMAGPAHAIILFLLLLLYKQYKLCIILLYGVIVTEGTCMLVFTTPGLGWVIRYPL